MSKSCEDNCTPTTTPNASFRKVLWICLIINGAMFGIEIVAGLMSGSVSLQSNALDFLGDALNYIVSLYVLEKSLKWRAYSSIVKAVTFGILGLWILGQTIYHTFIVILPVAETMGWVSILALVANLVCAWILYSHREGDSNRQSVWICSRNDSIGNVAVLIAAGAVYFTDSKWPDLIVAAFMAIIAISGVRTIIRHARAELKAGKKNFKIIS